MNVILLSKFLSLLNGKKVLDVGAGAGEVSSGLYDSGLDVTAIDFSLDSYKGLNKLPIKSIYADLFDYFPDKKFDGVLFLNCIHLFHEKDWKKLLFKLMSFMSKDGLLLISAPLSNVKEFSKLFDANGLRIVDFKSESEMLVSGKIWHYWIVAK